MLRKALVLGAGGFIGGHLVRYLKNRGYWVRGVDIKKNEFQDIESLADDFLLGDLRDPGFVSCAMFSPTQHTERDLEGEAFDEVYQLAADMGGAGFVFTGENDADIMHNSALINLNVAHEAVKKSVKRVFYSSSACMYPEHNQIDPNNPNCEESSAYPANPDSEYGWEKLFSERLYLSFMRNYGLNVRIARYHNVFGPMGTWTGGREKAPAALCRKVAESEDGGSLEVWGTGAQTRSFLYIDECLEATYRLMQSDFTGPVNIGSEEMISINDLAKMVIRISEKSVSINNLDGQMFVKKYGYKCPVGVNGRNSDNNLYQKEIGWSVSEPLYDGIEKTYGWINSMIVSQKEKSRGH
jgi:nucleoside-diphosphate-sugar epimerase